MNEIVIDHEEAFNEALRLKDYFLLPRQHNLAHAYLDMVKQRDYWRTLYTGGVGDLPLENEQKGGEA